MKPGIDSQHFAGMRKSRTRGVGLRGDVDGFRASKNVWTCVSCTNETRINPSGKPYTRAKPRPCHACKRTTWAYSASQSEADRYAELKRRCDIKNLYHPPNALPIRSFNQENGVVIVRTYKPDFSYILTHHNHRKVIEDHKPHNRLTELAKFIHTLVWYQHGIDVLITWYTGRGRSKRIQQAWSSELR